MVHTVGAGGGCGLRGMPPLSDGSETERATAFRGVFSARRVWVKAGHCTGGNRNKMLFLARILGMWVLAALFAAMVFIAVRTGQINTRGGIIKRRRNPLVFWVILASFSLIALMFFVGGLRVLSGRL